MSTALRLSPGYSLLVVDPFPPPLPSLSSPRSPFDLFAWNPVDGFVKLHAPAAFMQFANFEASFEPLAIGDFGGSGEPVVLFRSVIFNGRTFWSTTPLDADIADPSPVRHDGITDAFPNFLFPDGLVGNGIYLGASQLMGVGDLISGGGIDILISQKSLVGDLVRQGVVDIMADRVEFLPTLIDLGMTQVEAPVIGLADVNGDGRDEIIAEFIPSSLAPTRRQLAVFTEDGTFQRYFDSPSDVAPNGRAFGNVLGSPADDLVYIHGPTGELVAFDLLNGTWAVLAVLSPEFSWSIAEVVDLSGDGRAEVILERSAFSILDREVFVYDAVTDNLVNLPELRGRSFLGVVESDLLGL